MGDVQQLKAHGPYTHMPSGNDSMPWLGSPPDNVLGIHMIGLQSDRPAPGHGTQSGSDGAASDGDTAFTAASGKFIAANTGDTIMITDTGATPPVVYNYTVTFVNPVTLTLSSNWAGTATTGLSWVISGRGPSNAGLTYLSTNGGAAAFPVEMNSNNQGGSFNLTTSNKANLSGVGFLGGININDQSGGGINIINTGAQDSTAGTGGMIIGITEGDPSFISWPGKGIGSDNGPVMVFYNEGTANPTNSMVFGIADEDAFVVYSTDNVTGPHYLVLGSDGVFMETLPTSNPGGSGQLWNNGGVVNIT